MTALAVWLAVWLAGTHTPPPPAGLVPHWLSDKAIHFLGYFVTGILSIWVSGRKGGVRWPLAIRIWAIIVLLAVVDEWTQLLVGRACEWTDALADACGGAFGILAGSRIFGLWRSNARCPK